MKVLLSRGEKITGLVGRTMMFLGTSIIVPEANWDNVNKELRICDDKEKYVVLKLDRENILVYSGYMDKYNDHIHSLQVAGYDNEDIFVFLDLIGNIVKN